MDQIILLNKSIDLSIQSLISWSLKQFNTAIMATLHDFFAVSFRVMISSQPTLTCSKAKMETPELCKDTAIQKKLAVNLPLNFSICPKY